MGDNFNANNRVRKTSSRDTHQKTGFHVVISWTGLLFGAMAGIGYLVLLQQFGVWPLTTATLALALVLGLVCGVLFPSLATLIRPRSNEPKPRAEPVEKDLQ